MNKVQQKTGNALRAFIIEVLERAAGDDETIDAISERCEALGRMDCGGLDEELIVNDPKVKAAVLKFVKSMIGSFQQMEEEVGGDSDD